MAKPRPKDIVESAKTAIAGILPLDVLPVHKRELLSTMIWKITEANGKHNLRYRSEGAVAAPQDDLIHEHVYPRRKLVKQLLQGRPDPQSLDRILEHAVACLVTPDEHQRLEALPKHIEGWNRYRAAAVRVFDTEAQEWCDVDFISLERTGCEGTCPVYRVVLRQNGTASYEGLEFVERRGPFEAHISEEVFDLAADLLDRHGFFSLEDSYSVMCTCLPSVTIIAGDDRQSKRVYHYGASGPDSLIELENSLDKLVEPLPWVPFQGDEDRAATFLLP